MQALILAAGMGKRLKELTKDNTKCMVKVNGVPLIDRMLHQLDSRSFSRIVVVTGYEGKKLIDHINLLKIGTEVCFVNNPVFDKTNNIYSLSLAKDYLAKEDTVILESDIIFEDAVLDSLIDDPRETLALVDKYESWMDGTCLRLDDDDNITDFISGKNFDFNNTTGCYKTVNIYKFSRYFSETHYIPFLDAYLKALGENEYYEQVLKVITMLDDAGIKGKRIEKLKWYEIDDIQDLDIAEALFCPDDEERVLRMEERFGGYWRFTGLLDFCYLVNKNYPTQKMKDEMRASFDRLLVEYPSGMKVNSLLAAKNFGVRPDNIVVGNGAAELMKSLLERFEGRTGFIRPTFEEYPNRYREEDSVVFWTEYPDYSYSADDIMNFFSDKGISNLIVINPDNPSGNYIRKKELLSLAEWCFEQNIRLVIDESFSDFADEDDNSFLDTDLLDKYVNLFIMKSISKSYGVPGLRLGVLASGDTQTIDWIKKDVQIWNINSFAEFYLQIAEKYKKQYEQGLILFKNERNSFLNDLLTIENIRVLPSQANFFMIELLNGIKAAYVTKELFVKHNILVKDLSTKLKGREYLRVAIRDRAEDVRFVEALRDVTKS